MRVFAFILLLFTLVPVAFAAEEYFCPMHPQINGEKGDTCPICGMTLAPKAGEVPDDKNRESSGGAVPVDALHVDPSYVQALGVRTAEVTHYEFGRDIRAFGKIAPSTRLEYAVDVRTRGWIVDLPVGAVGDAVKKGDLLFTYYSPDLMTAQSDFLIGMKIGNSEQRLRLFGMDEKAIAELKNKGTFFEKTPFYAPADGIVTMLNVRKGSHVDEGGSIIRLQDFSKLWVNISVPVKDVQFLNVGAPVTVTVPETGNTHETVLDYIYPVNDPQSRTVMVRLVLDNEEGLLRPDTYVDAVFHTERQTRLAVPAEAILYGAMGAYAMENVSDGYFKPVMVETGITANGLTEIKGGLVQGQRIVTSGQFMLDSESSLRGGMAAMGHNHGGGDMGQTNSADTQPLQQESQGHGQH